jgi:hypothetical protein
MLPYKETRSALHRHIEAVKAARESRVTDE